MAKQTQESQNFDLLSEVQARAAMQIALGRTGRAVAAELGVNEATISGWRQTPEFRAAVNRVLADAHEATSYKLKHASALALDTLVDIMGSETATDRDKLAACAQVLALTNPSQASPGPTTPAAVAEADAANEAHAALWAGLL